MSAKAFVYIILFSSIFGQLTGENAIYHIPPSPPTMGNSISFEATISIDIEVNEAIFLYRMKGQQSYKEIEMVESLGGTWAATILQVPEGNSIEYFYLFMLRDGSSIFLPEGEPNQNPFILSVIPMQKPESSFLASDKILTYQENDQNPLVNPAEILKKKFFRKFSKSRVF